MTAQAMRIFFRKYSILKAMAFTQLGRGDITIWMSHNFVYSSIFPQWMM